MSCRCSCWHDGCQEDVGEGHGAVNEAAGVYAARAGGADDLLGVKVNCLLIHLSALFTGHLFENLISSWVLTYKDMTSHLFNNQSTIVLFVGRRRLCKIVTGFNFMIKEVRELSGDSWHVWT